MSSEFTPKESRFIEEFPVDLNATAAARRAGYSERTAGQIGYENLRKPHIAAAIAKELADRSHRTRVTKDRVLSGIAELAYYDIGDAFNEDGSFKDVHELTPALRSAIAGIEVEEIKLGRGADAPVVGRIKKIKLVDRKGSYELLGRHLKLFTDKTEHSGGITLEEILTRSRET